MCDCEHILETHGIPATVTKRWDCISKSNWSVMNIQNRSFGWYRWNFSAIANFHIEILPEKPQRCVHIPVISSLKMSGLTSHAIQLCLSNTFLVSWANNSKITFWLSHFFFLTPSNILQITNWNSIGGFIKFFNLQTPSLFDFLFPVRWCWIDVFFLKRRSVTLEVPPSVFRPYGFMYVFSN